jgi:anti-sigma B factor antagonist
MMSVTIERQGDTVVACVLGDLVVGNRRELQQAVMAAIDGGALEVIVDLERAGYVDSAGLGTLVMLAKRVRAHGGELRLTSLNEDVRTLFALTKLDTVFAVGPARTPAA